MHQSLLFFLMVCFGPIAPLIFLVACPPASSGAGYGAFATHVSIVTPGSVHSDGVQTLSSIPSWSIPSPPENPSCKGKRIGLYTWDTSYWLDGNPELFEFLDTNTGRKWNCGNLYVNIGDYSSSDNIPSPSNLVQFAVSYRSRLRNEAGILFFTYGDVTETDGEAMIRFTETFFDWVESISLPNAKAMGRIGISYDVEHMDPKYTEKVLKLCRKRRKSTSFGDDKLIIQYVIEGDENRVGTDIAFRYADSVLAMLYSNYVSEKDPLASNSLVGRLHWFLKTQCVKCLDDEYASLKYRAKITVMVEASCKMGRSCSWASFCAYDGANEGAYYLVETLETAMSYLPSFISEKQFNRLFQIDSLFVVNSFEWYRCYQPFQGIFSSKACSEFHALAHSCRTK